MIEHEGLAEVMAARDGRPLLLIDLAVPRDIQPTCRELAGVSLYDMDDLQALVERNVSGREAEARRAEGILRAELIRFDAWLAGQDVAPTLAALRQRADEIVERVLDENDRRWEGLTEADRERLAAAARAIASRLLHEPTLRLRRAAARPRHLRQGRRAARALRARPGRRAARAERRRGLRPRRAPQQELGPRQVTLRIATRSSALALAQARRVAEAIGGAEVVPVRTDDAAVGDKARFVRGVEQAVLDGEADLAVHSAKDLPVRAPRRPRAGRRARSRGRPRRADRGRPIRSPTLPAGARIGTASLRRRSQLLALRDDLEVAELRGNVDTRLAKLAAGDYDAIMLAAAGPRPARPRRRDLVRVHARADDPRRGPGDAGASRPAPTTTRQHAAAAGITEPRGADRAHGGARRGRRARGRLRYPGRHLRSLRGRRAALRGYVGLADGGAWVRDRIAGDPTQPAALGEELVERMVAAGAGAILEQARVEAR